ncbi:MAG: RNA polymerase subunit sigma-70 [Ignavibacteria bacterium CG_4_8_14_3_um_filter_37_9]|nr:sigma-70 family RNA polymerase sigma factor [Ignavibacteria bacterium]OIO23238.1 MAG: RNA polymerase subunit sigma-70 [Ignavibacteria bacterium CG1_02_37_35]PIP77376.1 MAG: RNA polymerase subunit sigma-70 [Ignavibacteria bacterium CG22_combo_CG10-13_8_21_14_all_37_15]PIS45774.1 MAG: RNA polymerase subunit sigma-70 [Ignavibacteria bacterium CG08_land_8_20_14_0_20_37_9]PIX00447.1 MAG: RNA polymerase subunit sigma-70 [Ignavibacteria bacterium CG_4_8_14_3_um_filter_37_9]PIX95369.1 MAG: RNA poly
MNEINKNEKVIPQTILTLNDDFSLIKRFIDGDESVFKTLVNRHKEKVRNLIFVTLNSPDMIDDISQEVFISVYKKLDRFRFESQFTTWLYRITINKCRDHLRRVKIRSILSPFSASEAELSYSSVSLHDEVEIQEIVRKAVAQLPVKLKTPLILKDFEGLSYQEIAEAIGVEVGTIKSRIFRARESLKKILAPYKKELL